MFNFFNQPTIKSIHVNDIDRLIGTINLIDIREPSEFRAGSIRSAKNIPMQTLLRQPEGYLQKDQPYYLICQSGARSQSACRQLTKAGYDVTNVAGGVGSYVGSKRQ
ncbi:MAG: rhodanese-like domain-containing protein [Negativicutes bacterium]|nr:rhodanese-like domain-containing protein [Negativicutes bacterium]